MLPATEAKCRKTLVEKQHQALRAQARQKLLQSSLRLLERRGRHISNLLPSCHRIFVLEFLHHLHPATEAKKEKEAHLKTRQHVSLGFLLRLHPATDAHKDEGDHLATCQHPLQATLMKTRKRNRGSEMRKLNS